MADGFDEIYVDTGRPLRGVAESLIAGPPKHGVEVDVVRAVDHDIASGVWPDMREHGWAHRRLARMLKTSEGVPAYGTSDRVGMPDVATTLPIPNTVERLP